MNLDLSQKMDVFIDETKEAADITHKKVKHFHESYVSDKLPDCGKYGDEAKFLAEMLPGVEEYNAVVKGDWQAFAIAAGIDLGSFALGAGVVAFKGGSIAAKTGVKLATKEIADAGAKKAIKEGAEKATKEVIEAGAEKTTKEIAQEGTEKAAKEVAEKTGGSYAEVKKISDGELHEIHHMPADSVTKFDYTEGPAIRMDKMDHRQTASWGNSREARQYRDVQEKLISEGKIKDAIQMDIDDIISKFGTKYNEGIQQMLEYCVERGIF